MISRFFISFFSNSTVKYIFSKGKWVLIGKIVIMFSTLGLSVILTRNLSVKDYGVYQYFISILMMTNVLSFPDFNNSILKFTSLRRKSLFPLLLKYRFKLSFIGVVLILLFIIFQYITDNNNTNTTGLLLIAVFFPFYYTFNLYKGYYQGKEQFKKLNIILMTISILNFVVLSIASFSSSDIRLLLFLYLVIQSTINFIISRKIKQSDSGIPDKRDVKEASKLGIELSLVNICVYLLEGIDRFLIGTYINYEALGIFTIGITAARSIMQLFKEILNTFSPRLTKVKIKTIQYLSILAIGSVLGVILVSLAPSIIEILYTSKYSNSIIYCQLIFLSLGFYLVATLMTNQYIFFGKNNVKVVYVFNIFFPLLQILGMLIIIFLNIPETSKLLYLAVMFAARDFIKVLILLFLKRLLTGSYNILKE